MKTRNPNISPFILGTKNMPLSIFIEMEELISSNLVPRTHNNSQVIMCMRILSSDVPQRTYLSLTYISPKKALGKI